jgi:hypothetical protein
MKKHVLTTFFFLTLLSIPNAFAGTTILTTYYPPPVAAYNQVKLSTNYISSFTNASGCNAGNVNTIYRDQSSLHLYQCQTPPNPPTLYCSNNAGAVLLDNTGVLHVCTGSGTDSIFPQECFNSYCSTPPCVASCNQPGFGYLQTDGTVSASTTNAVVKQFNVTSSSAIESYICCSS